MRCGFKNRYVLRDFPRYITDSNLSYDFRPFIHLLSVVQAVKLISFEFTGVPDNIIPILTETFHGRNVHAR